MCWTMWGRETEIDLRWLGVVGPRRVAGRTETVVVAGAAAAAAGAAGTEIAAAAAAAEPDTLHSPLERLGDLGGGRRRGGLLVILLQHCPHALRRVFIPSCAKSGTHGISRHLPDSLHPTYFNTAWTPAVNAAVPQGESVQRPNPPLLLSDLSFESAVTAAPSLSSPHCLVRSASEFIFAP